MSLIGKQGLKVDLSKELAVVIGNIIQFIYKKTFLLN